MGLLQMPEVNLRVADLFDDIVAITLRCRLTNGTQAHEPEWPSEPLLRKELSTPTALHGGASLPTRMS
jgi:hypothetical protein